MDLNYSEFLKNNGISPSFQRIKIYQYLYEKRNHPTVDMIYKSLINEIPTLSKTTVYNTLKLFIEKNIAIIIFIEENETRYDADISLHGHFKCKICGNIFDFKVNIDDINNKELNYYEIFEKHVYFIGICKKCGIKKQEALHEKT